MSTKLAVVQQTNKLIKIKDLWVLRKHLQQILMFTYINNSTKNKKYNIKRWIYITAHMFTYNIKLPLVPVLQKHSTK